MTKESVEHFPSYEVSKILVDSIVFSDSGNIVRVTNMDLDPLIEGGAKLILTLNHSPQQLWEYEIGNATKSLTTGEEIRPGGCYAVSVKNIRDKNILIADNRNGHGVSAYVKELKEAVEAVFETKG